MNQFVSHLGSLSDLGALVTRLAVSDRETINV